MTKVMIKSGDEWKAAPDDLEDVLVWAFDGYLVLSKDLFGYRVRHGLDSKTFEHGVDAAQEFYMCLGSLRDRRDRVTLLPTDEDLATTEEATVLEELENHCMKLLVLAQKVPMVSDDQGPAIRNAAREFLVKLRGAPVPSNEYELGVALGEEPEDPAMDDSDSLSELNSQLLGLEHIMKASGLHSADHDFDFDRAYALISAARAKAQSGPNTLLKFIADECSGWKNGRFALVVNAERDVPWLLCDVETGCGQAMKEVWVRTIRLIDSHLETGVDEKLVAQLCNVAVEAAFRNCSILYHG